MHRQKKQRNERTGEVLLRVYDISDGMATTWSTILLGRRIEGIWHTGVVCYGYEYFYGGGIVKMIPSDVERTYGITPSRLHRLGTTNVPQTVFEKYLLSIVDSFTRECYDLTRWNCNNFSDHIVKFLLYKGIPRYVLDLPDEVTSTFMGKLIVNFLNAFRGKVPLVAPEDPSHPRNTLGSIIMQKKKSNAKASSTEHLLPSGRPSYRRRYSSPAMSNPPYSPRREELSSWHQENSSQSRLNNLGKRRRKSHRKNSSFVRSHPDDDTSLSSYSSGFSGSSEEEVDICPAAPYDSSHHYCGVNWNRENILRSSRVRSQSTLSHLHSRRLSATQQNGSLSHRDSLHSSTNCSSHRKYKTADENGRKHPRRHSSVHSLQDIIRSNSRNFNTSSSKYILTSRSTASSCLKGKQKESIFKNVEDQMDEGLIDSFGSRSTSASITPLPPPSAHPLPPKPPSGKSRPSTATPRAPNFSLAARREDRHDRTRKTIATSQDVLSSCESIPPIGYPPSTTHLSSRPTGEPRGIHPLALRLSQTSIASDEVQRTNRSSSSLLFPSTFAVHPNPSSASTSTTPNPLVSISMASTHYSPSLLISPRYRLPRLPAKAHKQVGTSKPPACAPDTSRSVV